MTLYQAHRQWDNGKYVLLSTGWNAIRAEIKHIGAFSFHLMKILVWLQINEQNKKDGGEKIKVRTRNGRIVIMMPLLFQQINHPFTYYAKAENGSHNSRDTQRSTGIRNVNRNWSSICSHYANGGLISLCGLGFCESMCMENWFVLVMLSWPTILLYIFMFVV